MSIGRSRPFDSARCRRKLASVESAWWPFGSTGRIRGLESLLVGRGRPLVAGGARWPFGGAGGIRPLGGGGGGGGLGWGGRRGRGGAGGEVGGRPRRGG